MLLYACEAVKPDQSLHLFLDVLTAISDIQTAKISSVQHVPLLVLGRLDGCLGLLDPDPFFSRSVEVALHSIHLSLVT
jgi:hypothetical protein